MKKILSTVLLAGLFLTNSYACDCTKGSTKTCSCDHTKAPTKTCGCDHKK